MTREAFAAWLREYGRAWETRDAKAAADLYAEDGTYQVTPFVEPMRGRAAILEYWTNVAQTEEHIRFEFEILAVTPEQGIARWRASFVRVPPGLHTKLDGIFVIALDSQGKCTVLREWWHKQQTERVVGASASFALESEELSGKGFEEAASPNADQQGCSEQQDGIKAGAALARPVHSVFQVEPEGELVQRKSRANTIKQRHQPACEQGRGLCTRANLNQPTKPDDQQEQDPPDQVVNMGAANVNVVERGDPSPGGVSHRTRQR